LSEADDCLLMRQMIEALAKVADYVDDLSEDQFYAQPQCIDAVALNLLILGESAAHLGDELTASRPELPWRSLVGLRHRIAHGYARVDTRILWKIASEDAPLLRVQLEQLLSSLDD